MFSIKEISSGAVINTSEQPVFNDGVWECGDRRFTDEDGSLYEVLPVVQAPPTVGPITFQLLWTAEERVNIEDLKASNKYVANFMKLLDDPRTDVVVMALPSIQSQIRKTLEALAGIGVIKATDVETRLSEILSGQLK